MSNGTTKPTIATSPARSHAEAAGEISSSPAAAATSVGGAAKEEVTGVASAAAGEAKEVAAQAKEQARTVARFRRRTPRVIRPAEKRHRAGGGRAPGRGDAARQGHLDRGGSASRLRRQGLRLRDRRAGEVPGVGRCPVGQGVRRPGGWAAEGRSPGGRRGRQGGSVLADTVHHARDDGLNPRDKWV
jgi:hypothetical protein